MYELFLMLHLLGLVLGLGGSLAGRQLTRFSAQNPDTDVSELAARFSMMNASGLLLLIATGFAMANQQRADLTSEMFQAKLALVGLLIMFADFIHMSLSRYRKTGNQKLLQAARRVQPLALATTLAIVVTAVLAFAA